MNYSIRQEQRKDYKETEEVVEKAFESLEESDQSEHHLVSKIRESDAFIPELSLVAWNEENHQILGHILLSKIFIGSGSEKVESLALAPVSVLPDYQGKGIGRALIENVIAQAEKSGFQSIVVVGHPEYYPKFGFKKASSWNIEAPFEVPDEAFMVLELKGGALGNVSGVVEYSSAFME